MGKADSPMKVFTPAWHESGCRETSAIRAYWDFWRANADRWPTAYRDCSLGWHDMEIESISFTEAVGGREDMRITLAYRSATSFFRDVLVFRNAELRKHNVNAGNVWLYSEVEILPDGRYDIRIMFHGGGEKRRYIKLLCDDVISEE